MSTHVNKYCKKKEKSIAAGRPAVCLSFFALSGDDEDTETIAHPDGVVRPFRRRDNRKHISKFGPRQDGEKFSPQILGLNASVYLIGCPDITTLKCFA